MILARAICSERREDFALALARIGLPSSASDYLQEKLPHTIVLLTGLSPVDGRFLKSSAESGGVDGWPALVSGDQRVRPGTALLSGFRPQFARLITALGQSPERHELRAALERLFRDPPVATEMRIGAKTFALGERTYVMGVVNVTPDSFSDGGDHLEPEKAIARGLELVRAGADILDVGGESTRPGGEMVPIEIEIERVLPVIRGLRDRTSAPISIDTRKAPVALEAVNAGAAMVNDVSGFHFDPEISRAVAATGVTCCLMHTRGTPKTMQQAPRYGDIVEDVCTYLAEGIRIAVAAGVSRSSIFVDPGIGFGKTVGHNLFLLRRLLDFRVLGLPIVVGTSRKSFLGALTGKSVAKERLAATLGSLAAIAIAGGADVVRVHDVAEARDALAVADALRMAKEGGDLFAPPVAAT